MPLIIITGLPCSGKTYRAQQITSELNAYIATNPAFSKRSVQIINSHHSSLDEALEPPDPVDAKPSLRDEIYNSASQEKTARAEEFSAIKRALAKDNIVIADGLNYIKGYRYQLWCEAKAVATRCCVVHVAAQEDECKKWNRERLRAWGKDAADEADLTTPSRQGPGMQGTNVLGDLAPESHTAVYGDRTMKKSSRSRSSSLDGAPGDGPRDVKPNIPDDSMTLKSLYISDKTNDAADLTGRDAPEIFQAAKITPTQATTTARSDVPLPSPASAPPYSSNTLTSLIMRYEPPSPFSRWDTPLFTIPSFDPSPPTDQIWAALYPTPAKPTSKKALAQLSSSQRVGNGNIRSGNLDNTQAAAATEVKRHAATVLPKAATSDALQVLESATMDVVKHLLSAARDAGLADGAAAGGSGGGNLTFSIPLPPPNENSPIEASIHIPPSTILSQPLLQRLRRKYTQIQRGGIAHGQGYVNGRQAVIEGFVGFLDDEWNNSE